MLARAIECGELIMKRSILVLFLFCALGAHRCESTVSDDVETVHENPPNGGARSGKMTSYDEFLGELDGYPDFNNYDNYNWGE